MQAAYRDCDHTKADGGAPRPKTRTGPISRSNILGGGPPIAAAYDPSIGTRRYLWIGTTRQV
jgi:hypothetical protein